MTSTAATATAADPESGSALISPQRRNFIFVAVLLGMLLAALDQTIVATALPTVVADLGGAGNQSWVVTSYLLASTIVTAIVGKLGDLFGRKLVFAASVLFFLAGSVLCGMAGSMTMLVASRALQGIGGGAIMVTATALIGEVIPLRDRGRYQGALGAVFGVTTVVGPLLGGFFTDHLSWRWAFWINVPVAVVVFFVAIATIPALGRTSRPVIDYAGIVLVGVGASGLTLATSWGGTSSFADLGVATSGVTFFRTIGSSFGAAIFGSLFTNFLNDRIDPALAASGAPPAAAQSPQVLHKLGHDLAAPIVNAYADSLGMVFLCAAPVAFVGFIVALLLKEVPLREMDAVSAVDLGEGFGMPSTESPDKVLETAIGRMMRNSPEIRLRSICERQGCDLDVARLWALIQIYRHNQVFGSARLTEIADRLRVPCEVLEPTFDRLVDTGYALRTGDLLWLTQTGAKQVDAVSSALINRIMEKLASSPTFEGRPDRVQVEAALDRIAHRVLVQRDWDEERSELATAS